MVSKCRTQVPIPDSGPGDGASAVCSVPEVLSGEVWNIGTSTLPCQQGGGDQGKAWLPEVLARAVEF
jgi:hypothetical protein